MKFSKTLIATALFASAGAANASIEGQAGGLNEAYLSAYDSTTGKTFTFDTGVTFNELVANVSNAAYSQSFDFSGLTNWTSFLTGASLSSIKYVVAVGNGLDTGALLTSPVPLVDSVGSILTGALPNALEVHAGEINTGLNQAYNLAGLNSPANLNTLVLDTAAPLSGQHTNAFNVWGTWDKDPQASYGQAVAFRYGYLDLNTFTAADQTFAGQWKLAGNSLSFAAPAAVPLPAAVWMFGAGLMGMLRLNRRKSMAV